MLTHLFIYFVLLNDIALLNLLVLRLELLNLLNHKISFIFLLLCFNFDRFSVEVVGFDLV